MQPTAHNRLQNQASVLPEHELAAREGCESRDRNDYRRFLHEYGISEEDACAVTNSGKRYFLPMLDLEVRESAIQGHGLFTKRSFKPGEIIAPALLDGYKTEAGRYTNHSGQPNARMVVRDKLNIDLVAVDEIGDKEITTDYRENLRVQGLRGSRCRIHLGDNTE